MSARLNVLRPFLLFGERQEAGTVIQVDFLTATELLNCGKVEPADAKTAARVHTKQLVTWTPAHERPAAAAELGAARIELCRTRASLGTRDAPPDAIHSWGDTAQLLGPSYEKRLGSFARTEFV